MSLVLLNLKKLCKVRFILLIYLKLTSKQFEIPNHNEYYKRSILEIVSTSKP